MTSGHIWGPITREIDLYTGLKLFLSKIYIVFCALKQFQHCQTCKSKSMSLWFRHIFTKKGKIQGQGSTLKANKTYRIHFVAKFFVVTQSRVCGQKMNAKYMCRKMDYRPFFGLPIQKQAENADFGPKIRFLGPNSRKTRIFPNTSRYPTNRSQKVLQLRGV